LNRDSLINHINDEGIKAPVKEDKVPFEAGNYRLKGNLDRATIAANFESNKPT